MLSYKDFLHYTWDLPCLCLACLIFVWQNRTQIAHFAPIFAPKNRAFARKEKAASEGGLLREKVSCYRVEPKSGALLFRLVNKRRRDRFVV